MFLFFNSLFQAGIAIAWWVLLWQVETGTDVEKSVGPGPQATAKMLSGLAAILILGLGGVLVIGLSGRWLRRWIYSGSRPAGNAPSVDSELGKLDWARPVSEPDDPGKGSGEIGPQDPTDRSQGGAE